MEQFPQTRGDNKKPSEIVAVRHGDSPYSDTFPDLTEEGKRQVTESALAFKDHLSEFDVVVALCSPATRAQGTAALFLETADLSNIRVRNVSALANFDIKDKDEFLDYMGRNSTSIYGELWLTDPLLAGPNELVESRADVEKRARRFLYHYANAIARIGKESNKRICALAFTHFEIGNEFLRGVFGTDSFPITEQSVLQNAEPVQIELDDPKSGILTITARGQKKKVKYDYTTGAFSSPDDRENGSNQPAI
jgi:broad specificity phosphatase PhoE